MLWLKSSRKPLKIQGNWYSLFVIIQADIYNQIDLSLISVASRLKVYL